MASQVEDTSTIIAEAQYSLRCSVCLDDFKEPKVLPCCHTFCKHCLEKISTAESSTKGPSVKQPIVGQKCDTIHREKSEEVVLLTCPQCRAQHKLTGGGVDALLTDYAIEDELDKVKSCCQKGGVESNLRCGLCESTDPVVTYCKNCSFPLCEFCHKAHQRLKQYNGHVVKSVGDVDSKLLSKATQRHVGHLVCPKHPIQVPQIFCSSCDELICCECVIEGHEGHKFVGVNTETRRAMEKKLSDTSSTVRTALEVFEKNLKYVETVEKVTNDTGTKVQADIKQIFDEFVSFLQKRRDDLLAKTEEKNNAKLKVIWSEKDFLEQMIAKQTTTLSFSERLQTCKNDGEYLSLASQALLSLRELERSSWDSKTVEEIDLCYVHLEKRINEPKIFQTAAKFDVRKNKQLKFEWKNFPVQVHLGEKHKCTICVTRDDTQHQYVLYNKPSVIIQHVQCANIDCSVADISIDYSITLPGAWDIAFTPYCGGCHLCIVSMDGADTTVMPLEVAGVPPLKSRIMRGPSWNYDIIKHAYGVNKSEVGLVTKHNTGEQTISVQWPDGKSFDYRWDTSGMFDIQLHH